MDERGPHIAGVLLAGPPGSGGPPGAGGRRRADLPEPRHLPATTFHDGTARRESWGYCPDLEDTVPFDVYDRLAALLPKYGGWEEHWGVTGSYEFPSRRAALDALAEATAT